MLELIIFNMTDKKTKVFVKTLKGGSMNVLVDLNDTVIMIKHLIYKQNGIEINRQRLIYCGQEMINTRVINSYHVLAQTTIHLVIFDKVNKMDNATLSLILKMKTNFDKILEEYKLLELENERLQNLNK